MTPPCLFIFFLKEKPTTKVSKSFDLLSDKIINVHDFFCNSVRLWVGIFSKL